MFDLLKLCPIEKCDVPVAVVDFSHFLRDVFYHKFCDGTPESINLWFCDVCSRRPLYLIYFVWYSHTSVVNHFLHI